MKGLEVKNLSAAYGETKVLHGIDLQLKPGGITALLGANGAGKTTTLRAILNALPRQGQVSWQGRSLDVLPTESIAALGIAHVPQGRGTLGSLSVEENLRLGAWRRSLSAQSCKAEVDECLHRFPQLAARRRQQAAQLSGGEQQMLAIARAMMMRPQLLLLDEPSLGLGPKVVSEVYQNLRQLNAEQGLTLLLVEQSAALALDLAHDAVVLHMGRVVCAGTAAEIRCDAALQQAYLGG
jgi:branched-chain amino acid transport system ATP-binding protein